MLSIIPKPTITQVNLLNTILKNQSVCLEVLLKI